MKLKKKAPTNGTFRLELFLGNAAVQNAHDVAAVLESVAETLRNCGFDPNSYGPLVDLNGNNVGEWRVR